MKRQYNVARKNNKDRWVFVPSWGRMYSILDEDLIGCWPSSLMSRHTRLHTIKIYKTHTHIQGRGFQPYCVSLVGCSPTTQFLPGPRSVRVVYVFFLFFCWVVMDHGEQ